MSRDRHTHPKRPGTPPHNFTTSPQQQIQCATGQIPGPNVPIPEAIAQGALAGAEAADPEGQFYWKMLAGAVRRAKLTVKDLV